MFNHKNPLLKDEDYEYYVRAVDRFRKIINSDEKIMFFRCIIKYNNNGTDIEESINILDECHPNNIHICLVINLKKEPTPNDYNSSEFNYYSLEKNNNRYIFNISCCGFPSTYFYNVELNNKIIGEIKNIIESHKE